ncbi:MAG: (d)CMP kinase [Tissierellia bacterium]|nr:(d)CMP kinase [Tissierellia bacterium]
MNHLIIAVDGPAGSGKSTLARKIADILGMEYIDTGAMYRALTLKVIEEGIDPTDEDDVLGLLEETTITYENNYIYLDGLEVDKKIRENIINKHVSDIAKIEGVRIKMVELQRELARSDNVIMDGRDIGTVVLPDANFKFFIVASVEERARRRYRELVDRGEPDITYQGILQGIKDRDRLDSTRQVAPLYKSPDAYEIDTTSKTVDESVTEILNIIRGGK